MTPKALLSVTNATIGMRSETKARLRRHDKAWTKDRIGSLATTEWSRLWIQSKPNSL